ncbi:MAG: hypothetical protein ACO1SV_23665 [Fimbriimonas sp.]
MPRKKPSVAAPEAATPTPESPVAVDPTPAKPARSSSRKKVAEPAAPPVETAASKPATKTATAKKPAAKASAPAKESAPVTAAKTASAKKAPAKAAAKPKVEPVPVEVPPTPEPPVVTPAKPAARRTKLFGRTAPSPAPEILEEVPEAALAPAVIPEPEAPKRGRTRSKAAPVAVEAVPKEPTATETEEEVEATEEAASDDGGKRRRSRRRGRRGRADATEAAAGEEGTPEAAPVPTPVEKEKAWAEAVAQLGDEEEEEDETAVPESALEVTAPEEARGDDYDWASQFLPEPTWRSRNSGTPEVAAAASEAPDADADEEDDGSRRGGRRRRRRRGGRNDAPEGTDSPEAAPAELLATKPAVEEAPIRTERKPEPTKPEAVRPETPRQEAAHPEPVRAEVVRRDRVAPKAPEKALIPIPNDAPQVVVRNGVPTLVRAGRVYPPVFFFGNPADERRAQNVLDEVRMAAESGVHLHSYLVDFEVDPNAVDDAAAVAAYMLAQSVQADPESQVVFRVTFQAPRGWQDRYPEARYRDAGGDLAEPSVCDDAFWGVARTCLERFIQKLRLLDLKDHILGLHLERGEWFLPEGHGYDTSKAAQTKFRDWARTRYGNDEVTLRASWFDGAVRFDTMQIPPFNPEGPDGEKFIRSSRKQRRYVDYHLFLSDATVGRIGDLAYAAKAASEGNFLIGVSYGYTFEWSHPDSGHLSLGKLLRTPEIDFIAGPPSYRSREPGGSAPFPAPIDSFALNGKLYISEEDYKTSLSTGHEPDDFNPRLKTPQALDSVHWRGAGAALAHGSGVAWMDLWGNGWLKTHSVWERAKHVREAMVDRMASPLGDPEVAVFIDERALAYLVDSHAFALLVQNVRESILRAGVSAGFYLLSDLAHREKFPESKLYLFLNAWDVRPELRAAIKSRLQRDNKVLFWLYSAGLFDAGRESLERAREVTGIALKPQPYHSKSGTTILNRRHPLSEAFPDRSVVGGTKLEPSYFAIPEGATVLGEYSQTGLPSFVVKEFNEGPTDTHWTSVFLGEPLVNPALIRALAQMSGAHVWNFHEDVVHVRAPFCTVHCANAGPRTLTLPSKYSAYNLLTNEWTAVDTANLKFTAVDGSTHCFLIGPKDDIEGLLKTDPSELLRMAQLPPRELNVRHDVSNFDVPVMRLDEWIEGSDGDDNADEWFLRPAKIEEEVPEQAVESAERVGKRRRRRRGGRDGEDDAPSTSRNEPRAEVANTFEDVGLSVVFRKRE